MELVMMMVNEAGVKGGQRMTETHDGPNLLD